MHAEGAAVPLVTFSSDYGTADAFVGLCHAAVLAACPDARIVDLSHTIRPQDVTHGAARLVDAVGWIDGPAVHLAVVDPGVGTRRRGVLLRCGRSFLVGPDNGLLVPAGQRLGGIDAAWVLDDRPAASATFHGRDVFAPAAGRIADGVAPSALGRPLDPQGLAIAEVPPPVIGRGSVRTHVRDIDRFGNLQLAVERRALGSAGIDDAQRLRVRADARVEQARRVRTFADLAPGELGLIEDSFGWMALVRNGESAAAGLGMDLHAPLTVEVDVPEAARGT